jgi:hypothetical protein
MSKTPTSIASFRRWLTAEIAWLQRHEPYQDDLQLAQDSADLIDEARRIAVNVGLPEAAKLCRSDSLISLVSAQEVLSACLAAIKPQARRSEVPSDPRLTPPQVAKRYGVNPDTVRSWIASNELRAVNVAAPGSTRPRYRVEPEALAEFDLRRQTREKAPRQRRRRAKHDLIVRRFSSDH